MDAHAPTGAVDAGHAVELRREAATMALYVTVCLLAALTAVADRVDAGTVDVLRIVWGTTVGLALAHWFAFRLSARLVAAGTFGRHEASLAAAQLGGAAAIAVLATVAVVVLPASTELDVVRILLAAVLGLTGFEVARSGGVGRGRAMVYAAGTLVLAVAITVVKNVLGGH